MMNGRYVSFSPVAFSNSARFLARIRAMRVKSTSKNELTCADVCRDITMCSLMSARIFDIGSTRSPGHGSGSGPRCDARRGDRGTAPGAACAARRTRGIATRSRLRDAAGDASSLQPRDLDAVLGGHAPHERRRLGAEAILEASCRRCVRGMGWRGDGLAGAGRGGCSFCRGGGRPRLARVLRPAPTPRGPQPPAPEPRADRRVHVGLEARDDRLHRNRLAFGDENLGEHAARRRRNLGVDLVRRNLEDRLVALHLIADLLQPLRQRPLGDRFAHLGHDDVYACHRITLVPSCACACAHVGADADRDRRHRSPRPRSPRTPRM